MHLERVILILEIVGQSGDASVGDICAHSDLPKPTAYRIVQDLVSSGLLEGAGKGRYAIGDRLRRIARDDQSDASLISMIRPTLARAATQWGAAFFLSRLRGRAVEIVHVETPDSGVSYLHPGLGRRPLHACSCSKAVLAVSSERLLDTDTRTRLKPYTEYTLTSTSDLEAELELILERGYAECVEEIEYGMASVAAPLGRSGPGSSMSIGATGSTRVFTPEFRAILGPELKKIASEMSNLFSRAETRTVARIA